MRRALTIGLLALSSVVVAACSGQDAQRAQELLQQSGQAMSGVKSMSFAARMWTDGAPQNFTMRMSGGALKTGPKTADFYVKGGVEGVPAAAFQVVMRRGTAYMEVGGRWTALPPSADDSSQAQALLSGFDLTRYIKSVSVDETAMMGGEPVAKIVGVIDTAALLKGLLSQLGPALQGGPSSSEVSGLSDNLGDARAVLYLSERTHILKRALLDLTVKADGKKVGIHMDLALLSVNEPVQMPGVGAAA